MKTARQILIATKKRKKIPLVKYLTIKDLCEAVEEYHQQFASQSSDKEEREVKDGFEKFLEKEIELLKYHKDVERQFTAMSILKEYRNFSPPKESEGKELSQITDEDAIKVAEMFPKDYGVSAETGMRVIGGLFNIPVSYNGCLLAMVLRPSGVVAIRVYQYLQYKGYKLPKYF